MEDSKVMEKQIDLTREQYRNVAHNVSKCYFAILALNRIDFMYQWSMEWFGSLIDEAASRAEQN